MRHFFSRGCPHVTATDAAAQWLEGGRRGWDGDICRQERTVGMRTGWP